jgi:hypothetical protein
MTTSSSGSVETSANSRPGSFSFSNANASFTDMLGSSATAAGGGGASGYKSLTPPSLPLSPSLMSPSSYFNMPAGMNLADFLDSPVLLTSSVSKQTTTTEYISNHVVSFVFANARARSFSDFPIAHDGSVRVAAVQLEAGGTAGERRRAGRQGRAEAAVLRLLLPDGGAGEQRGCHADDDDDDGDGDDLPATGPTGEITNRALSS